MKSNAANFQRIFSLSRDGRKEKKKTGKKKRRKIKKKQKTLLLLPSMIRLKISRCAVRNIGVFRLKQLSADLTTLISPFILDVPFFLSPPLAFSLFFSFFLMLFLSLSLPRGRFSFFPFNWPLSFPLSPLFVPSSACLLVPSSLSTRFRFSLFSFSVVSHPPSSLASPHPLNTRSRRYVRRRCPQIRIPHSGVATIRVN